MSRKGFLMVTDQSLTFRQLKNAVVMGNDASINDLRESLRALKGTSLARAHWSLMRAGYALLDELLEAERAKTDALVAREMSTDRGPALERVREAVSSGSPKSTYQLHADLRLLKGTGLAKANNSLMQSAHTLLGTLLSEERARQERFLAERREKNKRDKARWLQNRAARAAANRERARGMGAGKKSGK